MKSKRSQSIIKACAVLGVAVVGFGLAGCSRTDATPGAAAVVNGQRIEVRDVQTGTEEISGLVQGQKFGQDDMLYGMIAGPSWIKAASDAGLAVSAADAEKLIDNLIQKTGIDPCDGSCSPATVAFVQATLSQSKLQNAGNSAAAISQVGDEIAKLSVEVNPRYGSFDLSKGSPRVWAPTQFAWLATPAAAPAAG